MSNKEKNKMLNEAHMQTKALKKLEKWLRNSIAFSTVSFVIAYWGVQGENIRFTLGIISSIFTLLSVISAIIINLGIRNGKRNVEKIFKLVER